MPDRYAFEGFVLIAATLGLVLTAWTGGRASAAPAAEDSYPRPVIRIVFPFPAGGVAELGRLVAERMATRLRQPVVFEPRPGASGNPGA